LKFVIYLIINDNNETNKIKLKHKRGENTLKKQIIVSQDGTGEFSKVQEAIDSICVDEEVEIFVKEGCYYEKLIFNKDNVTLVGENPFKTILEYDDYALKKDEEGKEYTTYRTYSVCIECKNFKAKNITFRNFAGPGEIVGQAVAVQVLGDRCIFENCRFLAFQDTFYTKGIGSRIYVKKCYIEGDIDFIFGASIAVFEECIISSIHKEGYVSAPSTPKNQKYGYLFDRCNFVSELDSETVYLGRPWHPGGDPDAIGSAIFKKCNLGKHIKKEGFTEMKGFRAEDARFYEFENIGVGAVKHNMRRQLEEVESEEYTALKMLKGDDNWEFWTNF
jgi:pectinesterase